ncbi:sensor histidine kinase [Microbacterium laevaniformans]|uniref:sensor histidine kinase n=1 Tax=Microbacterium laevaniformans TaxID=36807 RepID=UPI00362D63A8
MSREAGRVRERGPDSVWERYGWVMAVVWLVFLIYPILGLLRSAADAGWVVTGWVALVAFVLIYVAAFLNGMSGDGGGLLTPPRPIQWVAFAALIVCAALTIPAVSGNALSFVPFVMSFASYGLTRPAHWATVAGGIGVAAATVLLLPDGVDYVAVLAIIVLLATVNTVTTALIVRSVQAQQLEVELATSEGREAVARDVHDLIGHSLTVVRVKAQLARRLIATDPERADAELADIEALTAEALSGVRETVAGIRSATLADELATSRDVLRAAGVGFVVHGDAEALSPAQALTASWILREATTNVLRHASASSVSVRIRPGGLVVADDGRGIRGPEGNGVRGMRERAAMSGARLSITAAGAGGTSVEVTW